MEQARANEKPYTADRREIYAWGVGGITNHALICTFGQVTAICILGFGLSPILISWVMTLPRFLDGIVDPLLGHLSDDTHTRWGRRKPFMVVGSVLAAMFLAGIWWVNRSWSPSVQFVYLLACTTLFYTCWGIYSMAWTAMGYELTDDYHERSRVQGIAGLFLTMVLVVNGWIYWLALRPMFGDGGGLSYKHHGIAWTYEFAIRQLKGDPTIHANEVTGIRWIASVIAIVAIVAAMFCVWTCKERFGTAYPRKDHVALLPAMKATLKNRPFMILLLQRGVGLFGGRICGGVSAFLGLYYVCGGDKDLSFKVGAIGGTVSMAFGLALMPFMKNFSQLMGKREALIMGAAASLLTALIAPWVTLPGHPYLPLIPGIIFMPLGIIASTLGDALLPDICDYDELLHGQRREGLFTAVLAFFSKMEMSVAALGVGYLIAWTGYTKDLPMQSAVTIQRMWWVALIPNIFCALAGLLLILKFPMTEATTDLVRRQLDARHAHEAIAHAAMTQITTVVSAVGPAESAAAVGQFAGVQLPITILNVQPKN